MDIVFKISLVNTDKPVRKVIQKYHVWDTLNEAICYQQILIFIFRLLLFYSLTSSVESLNNRHYQ